MGDGTTAQPTDRQVQGVTGSEIVVNGVHRVVWQPVSATPPCINWVLVAQGLSEPELTDALESVREAA